MRLVSKCGSSSILLFQSQEKKILKLPNHQFKNTIRQDFLSEGVVLMHQSFLTMPPGPHPSIFCQPWSGALSCLKSERKVIIRKQDASLSSIRERRKQFIIMGLDATKPVFQVSDKGRFKPACSVTETS